LETRKSRAPLSSNSSSASPASSSATALREAAFAHFAAGRNQAAERLFLDLLAEAPDDLDVRYHCALAQIRDGRGSSALEHSEFLLSKQPEWPGSHAIHGEALLSLSRYDEALGEFDWLASRLEGDPLCRLKRGLALAALGRFEHARVAFDAARAIDASFVEAFCRELSADREAIENLDPNNIFLWRRYLAQRNCDWRDWDRYLSEFRRAIADPKVRLDRALAYSSLQLPLSAPEKHALARKIAAEAEARVAPLPPRPASSPARRLRIGVLSSGLKEHVDILLLLPLFELIDRQRFELYAYSLTPDDRSPVRDRLRRAAAEFRDLSALRNASAAQQIRRDGIDILIDADGYCDGARFEITAARPAPLQVLYLCYASTLGSSRVDYTILDRVVAPPGHERWWSEQIVYLPETYFLYDFTEARPEIAVTRAEYGLPDDAPVLCAHHKAEKIDPETFALWCRVLAAVPSAVLWLLADRPEGETNLRGAAELHGIDPGRLRFAGRERRERYLARLALADLFLDAIHHNAIVTACDSLSMGLPVLTLRGTTCSSLSAESILRAAQLGDLIASDKDAYVRCATDLLHTPKTIAAAKSKVPDSRQRRTPLFDTASRVRELEAAFVEMWRRHRAGERPASFSVPPQQP
jgi:predicted O-linked N-acetylglucosamine transferase (SPINDLY family)